MQKYFSILLILINLVFFQTLSCDEHRVQQNNVSIHSDVRIFTLYAFFNGVLDYYDGTDEERYTDLQKSLRKDILEKLKTIKPETVKVWSDFFENHKYHLYNYLSFILTLENSDSFKKIIDTKIDSYLPILDSFRPVFIDFYNQCDIEKLYEKYTPSIIQVIAKYDFDFIQKGLNHIYAYLRQTPSSSDLISINILPIPFEQKYVGYCIRNGSTINILESAGATNYGVNIHEHLHPLLHPMIVKHIETHRSKFQQVLNDNINKPYVKGNYEETLTFVEECLVRALDHKISLFKYSPEEGKTRMELTIQEEAKNGLVLVPYFYEKLEKYESDDQLILSEYLGQMLLEYNSDH